MTTKRIILVLTLSALLGGWTINGYAQTGERNAGSKPQDAEPYPVEQSPQGSWRLTVIPLSGETWPPFRQLGNGQSQTFRTLVSFNNDGVLANALPSFNYQWRCEGVECPAPPAFRVESTPGMGACVKVVENSYMFNYVHLLHDSDGRDVGELKTHAIIILNDAQTFSGEFVTEMLNENGQRVMSYAGKLAGQRINVEGLPLSTNGLRLN